MYNIDENDLNGSFNFSPFINEFVLESEESSIVNDKDIDKNQEKNESNSYNDSTKGTFSKGNNEKEIISGKAKKKENKNLGRKKKNSQLTGAHDKYMYDNIRRKIKHLITKILLNFINEKIKEKYQSFVGKGVFIKKLMIINQKQIDDATVLFNRDFLKKSIGDIFSVEISTRYKNYPLSHNKNLIHSLKDEKDTEKKSYFNKLFNLTFMDTLDHFRKKKVIEELNGMQTFDSIKQGFKDDEDYLKMLEYSIKNYETLLNNQRIRRGKKKETNTEDNKNH